MRFPSVFRERAQGPLYLAAPRNDKKHMTGVVTFFVWSVDVAWPNVGNAAARAATKTTTADRTDLIPELLVFMIKG